MGKELLQFLLTTQVIIVLIVASKSKNLYQLEPMYVIIVALLPIEI